MARLISVPDELYMELSKLKGEGSYSEVIRSLIKDKSNKELVLSFAGKGGVDEQAIKDTAGEWKRWSARYA